MYQFKNLDDTIVAIATPVGVGGIGVIRLSGKKAIAITGKMFQSASSKKLSDQKSHTLHYGWIVRKDQETAESIDEVMVALMRAPASYTKEDVVEISSHSSAVALKNILSLAVHLGARLAEPGEFTKRAFLNGRIDLTQAEAVLDIIHSKTDAFLKVSTHQLKGELAQELEVIREELMSAYVEMEAIINFPEDDTAAKNRQKVVSLIRSAQKRIDQLLATSEHGRLLKEGIKIVLCGKVNVGKSSLLNLFLKQPRAIVSEIAGTTRDTIEEAASIGGIAFQLIDTAGMLTPRDLVEEEAIRRSRLFMEAADLVLLVLDNSQALTKEDEDILNTIKDKNFLAVINKCDLASRLNEQDLKQKLNGHKTVKVSALAKTGMKQLEDAVLEIVGQAKNIDTQGLFVSNLRHVRALEEARGFLKECAKLIKDDVSPEFVSENIKQAVNHLDNITGRNIDADLLDQIFSQFCIGK